MDKLDVYTVFVRESFFKGLESVLFLYGGVRNVTKTAGSDPNQVAKKVAEFSQQTTIGFVDTDECLASLSHATPNSLSPGILPSVSIAL